MSNDKKLRNTFGITTVSNNIEPSNRKLPVISREILVEKQINEAPNIEKKVTKKSTFELPVELHKRLKTAAVEREMTMLEIVEESLENYLK